MKRIISLLLCALIVFTAMPVLADSDIIGTAGCVFDTYKETKKNTVSHDNDNVMIVGSVYDRTAYLKFDISDYVLSDFKGCYLTLTMRNPLEDNEISIYSYDFDTKAEALICTVPVANTGKVSQGFIITNAVKSAIENGKTTLGLAVRSNTASTTIFASESSNASDRPSLTFTLTEPYVRGHMAVELPVATESEMLANIKNAVAKGHPWLFGTKEQFDRVRENAFGKDELMTKLYAEIKAEADLYLKQKPEAIDTTAKKSNIGVATKAGWDIIPTCAFIYLIEGDEKYARRAWQEAERFVAMEGWGVYQYLDNNQIASGVAICYDWLYDWLTPEQRDSIYEALRTKHLDTVLDVYRYPDKSGYGGRHSFLVSDSNQGILNSSEVFIQALAICDRDADYSGELMRLAMVYLNNALKGLYPDSAWEEGIGYWGYVGGESAKAFIAMKSAFGHCFGYENNDVVMNNPYFPIYGCSTGGAFVINDTEHNRASNTSWQKFLIGALAENMPLQKYSIENDELNDPFFLLYYDPAIDYTSAESEELDLDILFRNVDMVTMRDTWHGGQELFGGMVVQEIGALVGHAHQHSGTFAVHAWGSKWVSNPGKDEYSLPGYSGDQRWNYYAKRAESSNCIVINPSTDGGQNINAPSKIDTFVTKDKGAYAITDLTTTYDTYAKDYKRGVMLDDDRTRFTMQDELKLFDKSEVYSFVNLYECDGIEISSDGKTVVTSKGDKKVYIQIFCDKPYEISLMDSVPLPTSPKMPGQSNYPMIKKLAIHLKNIDSYNMKVVFRPYLADEELSGFDDSEFVPISEWSIPDGELVKKPALTDLTVNGTTIDGFHAETRYYEYVTEEKEIDVRATAPDGCSAEVKNDDGKYTVYLKKGSELVNTYVVRLVEPEKGPSLPVKDLTGLTKVKITSASATGDDGNVPSNAIDDDMYTRWSASGEHSITIKLAQSVKVNCIGLAFYNGDKRSTLFDVLVSADGKNWKSVSKGNAACGLTSDFEYFDMGNAQATYIRLDCHGNTVNAWNSISEISVYKK